MTVPGMSVTMDEIGEQLAAAEQAGKSTDLAAVKLEGDGIPAELQGKTVADLLRDREILAQSMQIANAARQAAEANAQMRASVPAPVVPPAPVPSLSKEQLAEMFEQDPISAVAYMQEIAIKNAESAFERRFAPLSAGVTSTAETAARAQFKNEFELFGPEIQQVINSIPDKSVLANPEGWQHVISYVRGKPGNFEKLMERSRTQAAEAAALTARDGQDRSAGASLSSSTVRPVSVGGAPAGDSGGFGLDADERRVADVMGMSYKDYAHWKKIGG